MAYVWFLPRSVYTRLLQELYPHKLSVRFLEALDNHICSSYMNPLCYADLPEGGVLIDYDMLYEYMKRSYKWRFVYNNLFHWADIHTSFLETSRRGTLQQRTGYLMNPTSVKNSTYVKAYRFTDEALCLFVGIIERDIRLLFEEELPNGPNLDTNDLNNAIRHRN